MMGCKYLMTATCKMFDGNCALCKKDNPVWERDAYRSCFPLERAQELAAIPTVFWRVLPNKASNDWNDEPEYRIQKYYVFAYDKDADKYWVETPGYHGFKRRHWLNNKGLHLTLESAEAALAATQQGGDGDG